MKVCGLTGGVGMGKSTAAEFLRARGAQVLDTDEIARELVQPGQPALAEIQTQFGKKILASKGGLNRAELAKIVFADADARKRLEEILHPRIRERWLAQIEIWRKENCKLAIIVIPLLFETHAESHFDKIICVACSANSQRERLLARGWTLEQIRQRIAAQMPIEEKIAHSHFVIWTEGDLKNHEEQLDCLLQKL
ncbi:MAG TPA: dephospho-CoA kinase [Verrucomicrobiae bacterium]|jgi:dephospho-CoA kinase